MCLPHGPLTVNDRVGQAPHQPVRDPPKAHPASRMQMRARVTNVKILYNNLNGMQLSCPAVERGAMRQGDGRVSVNCLPR